MKQKILVLGSSSWLGSALLNRLSLSTYQLISTVFRTQIEFNFDIEIVKAESLKDYQDILKSYNPEVIVNFLRGENEEDYDIHKNFINYCSATNSHYIYASSALALDAYDNVDLTEHILAKSVSEYGIFKGNCEQMLYDSKICWSVLRFSSLQGYCAHKFTRNEAFLNRLHKGEDIYIDSGVYQNRMFVDDMILIVEKIIEDKINGIIHIGTIDTSEEIDFLRKQANLFGYSSDRVKSNGNIRNVNLNCKPKTILELSDGSFKVTEEDTLKRINSIKEFDKYRKT